MDFTYSEEQEAVRELAERIFGERSTHERLKELEQAAGAEGPFDRVLWASLAEAGLRGSALPEDVGGAGLDFVAACLVVEAAGRTAAAVPVVETLAYGAPALDRFGTDDQRRRWLGPLAAGQAVVTAALSELVGEIDSNRQQGNLSSAIRLFVLDYFRTRAMFAAADSKPQG